MMMATRIGLIARMDNTGLGTQTHEFYKHMQPAKTLVVDISHLNGNQQHPERYPDATFIKGFPDTEIIRAFLNDLDVVFIAEAAYNNNLYSIARQMNVKTAVAYNYEFFDWFNDFTPRPDMFIAPSSWHYNNVDVFCKRNGIRHKYLHSPVNREALPFRQNNQARTFLHIAGKPAAHDRNGTKTVIEAAGLLKTDAKIIIHFQGEQGLAHQATSTIHDYKQLAEGLPNLTIQQHEYANYKDIYKRGDVMVLPRRYGGNCLPMNEALSVGMPVIMPNISPNNQFLPQQWLVSAYKHDEFTPRTKIDIYEASAQSLADCIDTFYEMSEVDMLVENVRASNLAETISWKYLEWEYKKALEDLVNNEGGS
jgi:glycosyltransferase involved in cell wall biosynthesis